MNDRYGIIWGSEPRYATCDTCGELAVCYVEDIPLCAKHRDQPEKSVDSEGESAHN